MYFLHAKNNGTSAAGQHPTEKIQEIHSPDKNSYKALWITKNT